MRGEELRLCGRGKGSTLALFLVSVPDFGPTFDIPFQFPSARGTRNNKLHPAGRPSPVRCSKWRISMLRIGSGRLATSCGLRSVANHTILGQACTKALPAVTFGPHCLHLGGLTQGHQRQRHALCRYLAGVVLPEPSRAFNAASLF